MSQYLKGSALALDEAALPAAGSVDGELRFSSADQTIRMWSASLSAWVLVGGGAGGGDVDWYGPAGKAPVVDEVLENTVFLMDNDTTRYLLAKIKVPDGYQAGNQVQLKLAAFSSETTLSYNVKVDSYLIRKDTTAIDSVALTETDTQVLTNAAPANKYREISFNLTNASGEIGGTALAAGDIISVKLSIASAVATTPLKVLTDSTEVKF